MCIAYLCANATAEERTKVFFLHGANVSEENSKVWGREMFKRLWHTGAKTEFIPVAWRSDIGASWNYHENVSNAFVTASFFADLVKRESGRKIIIAHSLGTMVAASAMQDYGADAEKLIMLNSAIPSEAFAPQLADYSPDNHLVHIDWVDYPSQCWSARWHELFDGKNDSRGKLTWRGRFEGIKSRVINFYSSGDEVLEIYTDNQNPAWYNGMSPSGNWGERYSWHKQEIWKGRKSLLGFMGTTDWIGWGFKENIFGFNVWSSDEANAITDYAVFATNTVFKLEPDIVNESNHPQYVINSILAQGIPALSPAAGITDLNAYKVLSFDMNAMKNGRWPRSSDSSLGNGFLHSDIKNVAYIYTANVFKKIVELGELK